MDSLKVLAFDINTVGEKAIEWLVSSGIKIGLILLVMFIMIKLTGVFSRKIFGFVQERQKSTESAKRLDTLSSIVRYVFDVSIIAISALLILSELGIQIGPILAAAGVLGLAVGFGAQSLVKDVISGFFILLEDQIRVGDVVQIAGKAGFVEKINLRMTILRDIEGKVHYVPNGQIDVVSNLTKEFSYYVFEIGVAYKENIDHVMDVIKEVAADLRTDPVIGKDIIEDMEILGLDKFADSALIVKTRIKTQPIRQWAVAREFNRRLKNRFDKENIEIPFPHLTMYMGEGKQGKLHLHKE